MPDFTFGLEHVNEGLIHDALTKGTVPPPITIPPVPTPAPPASVSPFYTMIVLQNAATVLGAYDTTDWDTYFDDNVAGVSAHPLKLRMPTVGGEITNVSQDDTQYRMSFDVASPTSITARLTSNGGGAGSGQQVKFNGAFIHRNNTAAATRETFTLTLPLIKGRNTLNVAFQAGNAGCMFFCLALGPGQFVPT